MVYLLLVPFVLSFNKSKKDFTIIAIFYQKWVVFESHTVIKTFSGLSADKPQLFFLFGHFFNLSVLVSIRFRATSLQTSGELSHQAGKYLPGNLLQNSILQLKYHLIPSFMSQGHVICFQLNSWMQLCNSISNWALGQRKHSNLLDQDQKKEAKCPFNTVFLPFFYHKFVTNYIYVRISSL